VTHFEVSRLFPENWSSKIIRWLVYPAGVAMPLDDGVGPGGGAGGPDVVGVVVVGVVVVGVVVVGVVVVGVMGVLGLKLPSLA
jgi:hypothetical protein